MTQEPNPWFPLFEFQDWTYKSILLSSNGEEGPPTPTVWLSAKFACGQAFDDGDGYTLSGSLTAPGASFDVSCEGKKGLGNAPATFKATGRHASGAVYELVGWAEPRLPLNGDAGRIARIRGSILAASGADQRPEVDLAGVPVGTVGFFEIAASADA